MPTALADYFQPSYRISRERLLEAAHRLSSRHGLCIDSRALRERGPDGETLALDFLVFGARRPRQALVLSSGTHGVEGFVGSAVQHYVLDRVLPEVTLADDTAVVIQHANNPYGFAWLRRVNEGNVDINRNFRDRFDPSQCPPDYELLYEELNPPDLDPENEKRRMARLQAFAAEHGPRRLQQAAVEGQYKYPRGIQFGGQARSASVAHLIALVREHLGEARTVAWLDFHTGLGGFGDCELVTGAPMDGDCYRFSQEVWHGKVVSVTGDASVSTKVNGVMDRGIEPALPTGCRLAIAFPEFGTYESQRVLGAFRADNWLQHYGDRDSKQGRAIKAELLEMFAPASREWRERVVATSVGLVQEAMAAITGIRQ